MRRLRAEVVVRLLRGVWNAGSVSLLAGIGGGLLLGWLLSRGGNGWLTPLPWIIYAVALVVFAVALSLLWPAATQPPAALDDVAPDQTAAPLNANGELRG